MASQSESQQDADRTFALPPIDLNDPGATLNPQTHLGSSARPGSRQSGALMSTTGALDARGAVMDEALRRAERKPKKMGTGGLDSSGKSWKDALRRDSESDVDDYIPPDMQPLLEEEPTTQADL